MNTATEHCAKAQKYLDEGKSRLAMREFDKAIDLAPTCAEAYLGRGMARWHWLSTAYRIDCPTADSVEDFDFAARLQGDLHEARRLLGMACAMRGEHERAIQALTEYLRETTCDVDACYWRAVSLEAVGRLEEAVLDYTAVTWLDSEDPSGYASRGSVLRKLGRLEAAIQDFSEALRWAPAEWRTRKQVLAMLRESLRSLTRRELRFAGPA